MSLLSAGPIVVGRVASGHVSISVTDRSSEGWLSGYARCRSGPFSGSCRVSFYQGELRRFVSDVEKLYRGLVGTVQLSPMEPFLEMTLTGNGRGLIVAEGTARESFVDGIHLSFRIDFDQTDLPSIIAALRLADPA
jgi:hypothetical protein